MERVKARWVLLLGVLMCLFGATTAAVSLWMATHTKRQPVPARQPADWETERESLLARANRSEARIKQLAGDLAAAGEKAKSAERFLDIQRKANKPLQEKLTEVAGQRDQALARAKELEAKTEAMASSLAAARSEAKKSAALHKQIEGKLKTERQAFEQKLAAERRALEKRLAKTVAKTAKLSKTLAAANARAAALTARVSELKAAKAALEKRCGDLEAKLKAAAAKPPAKPATPPPPK